MNPIPNQTETGNIEGRTIHTVSQLTRKIKRTLDDSFQRIWVVGEISNLSRPASGHLYFTLKDEKAQLSAVMWRSKASATKFELRVGLEVLVYGNITVYEPRGNYQIIVDKIEPKGIGILQLAFLQMREKLETEGLFAPERKRPLPSLPKRIALVTSASGAVVWDMINTITHRFDNINILLYPVKVQGEGAAQEIAAAIDDLNRRCEIDVMIVGRGGGSLEDLWAFNEEVVARAIYASHVPVISAVGHEVDVTIADLVADRRALTPTDAGQIVVPDKRQLEAGLQQSAMRLSSGLLNAVRNARHRLDGVGTRSLFRRTVERVRMYQQQLDESVGRLHLHVSHRVEMQRSGLDAVAAKLDTLSPLKVLKRGYSITQDEKGNVVRDATEVGIGDTIETRLACGRLRSRVMSSES